MRRQKCILHFVLATVSSGMLLNLPTLQFSCEAGSVHWIETTLFLAMLTYICAKGSRWSWFGALRIRCGKGWLLRPEREEGRETYGLEIVAMKVWS